MAKPSSHLAWGVSNPNPSVNIIEPSPAKKITGWSADERPAYEFMNWLFFRQDEWNKYFESQTDAFQARYGAIIGTGADATHATLQAANDDGALGSNVWVLVQQPETINTTITLNKAGWRIDFAPGVAYTKGSATTGVQLGADGIEINQGRFIGFSTGGDIAIEQIAAATYCKVIGTRFTVGTDTEVDQSAVPAGKTGPVSDTITEI